MKFNPNLYDGINRRITQVFGANRWAYLKYGLLGHDGTDFAVPTGTGINAVLDGYVLWAKWNGAYGNEVRLAHSGGSQTCYAHLKSFSVKAGQTVKGGQRIGISDNTGNSSGPHLHFGFRPPHFNQNNGYKGWVNPLPYFSQDVPGESAPSSTKLTPVISTPAPTAPKPGFPKNVTTTTTLNNRMGPGTGYRIFEVLPKGRVVKVVSLSNGWYKTAGGHYISAAYTK